MIELSAKTPCAGLLPLETGGMSLRELEAVPITSIMPLNGKHGAVSTALEKAVGAALPDIGRSLAGKSTEVLWTGQNQFFLIGATAPDLPAGVTDQSDAWTRVALDGGRGAQVLARLCPVDCGALEVGDVIRSQIGHMSAIIICREAGFELMVFRAFASTLVHELELVMNSIAAQDEIRD
ncbi:MAG: sarcosine oxidase subunit gamma [Litoreibacter sp.]|nr:sarcosine oxidase subunit gamma [Litoreibacter sp.]